MKRAFTSLVLLASATPLFAQTARPDYGVRIHIGYGFTPSFDKPNGGSDRFEGPEIGVAVRFGTALRSDLLLEPSFFGGGRIRHGGDADADVYRLTLFAHRTLARGIGLRAGVGYANCTRARGGEFDGVSSVVFDFGGEFPFSQSLARGFSPYIDVHAVVGQKKTSGLFFGIGTKI